MIEDGDLGIGPFTGKPELHPGAVVIVIGLLPVIERICDVNEEIGPFRRFRNVKLLAVGGMVILVRPPDRNTLDRSVAVKIDAGIVGMHEFRFIVINEAICRLHARCDDLTGQGVFSKDEIGDAILMPVVVLGMEYGEPRILGVNHLPQRVQHLLLRRRALGITHAVDRAGSDGAVASNLKRAFANIDMLGGESQNLSLLRILYIEMGGNAVDDIRQ